MATQRRRKLTCPVCLHAERGRIERMRVAGTAGDILAEKFGVSRDSIYRHMNAHVPAELKAQIIADVPLSDLVSVVADEGMSLLDHLKVVRNTAMSAMLAAASVNDHKGTSSGAKRSVEVLREIGRLTGELLNAAPVRNYVQNNISFTDPKSMDRMEAMLIERLAPFPGALQAVQAGLMALDAPPAPMIDVTPHGGSRAA